MLFSLFCFFYSDIRFDFKYCDECVWAINEGFYGDHCWNIQGHIVWCEDGGRKYDQIDKMRRNGLLYDVMSNFPDPTFKPRKNRHYLNSKCYKEFLNSSYILFDYFEYGLDD